MNEPINTKIEITVNINCLLLFDLCFFKAELNACTEKKIEVRIESKKITKKKLFIVLPPLKYDNKIVIDFSNLLIIKKTINKPEYTLRYVYSLLLLQSVTYSCKRQPLGTLRSYRKSVSANLCNKPSSACRG